MSESLCRFELIFPNWVAWLVVAGGVVMLALGGWRLATRVSSGTMTWSSLSLSDIFPVLLFVIGLALAGAGIGGIAALKHQPFARWAAGVLPVLLSEADEPVTGDFNEKPLGEIVGAGGSTSYVIRLSPAARDIKISGAYQNALCDADLLVQICRNNSEKLSCKVTAEEKVLHVCAKSDDAACRDRTP
jgi:hypothetical protein